VKVFQAIGEAGKLRGCAVALGNFDGVHLGHQALFRQAKRLSEPAVAFTFHPHPGKVLQPELAPKLITLLPRKLELFEQHEIDVAIVQPFTVEYARTSASEFEALLLQGLEPGHLVVGGDFTYGAQRRGRVRDLRRAAAARGALVHLVAPVSVDGVVVSSSKIREYILEGRVGAARRLLGRYLDLDGTVVAGQGRGRSIGFPTANVDISNELRPAPGVYAVRARIRDSSIEQWGPWMGGAANIGVKPTFGGTEATVEIHLFDFTGDLYGKELRTQFLERLRPEQRFGSAAELASQIRRDVEAARVIVARVVH
jgi:riboflavin kinase/FMN adenylyltransferase